jgi:hypothetical protein
LSATITARARFRSLVFTGNSTADVTRESVDSQPDGRALRVHRMRYSRAVPVAGGIASRKLVLRHQFAELVCSLRPTFDSYATLFDLWPDNNTVAQANRNHPARQKRSAATWIPRSGSEHLAASASVSSPPLDSADELLALVDWAPDDVASFQLACRSFAGQLS